MPVLHRWDSSDSADDGRPANVWRYDETSDESGSESKGTSEDESTFPGKQKVSISYNMMSIFDSFGLTSVGEKLLKPYFI